mgnify:CR=1 FL=1
MGGKLPLAVSNSRLPKIKNKPVDATAVLFNKQELAGADGLKRYLLADRQGEQGLVSLDAVLDRREDGCLQGVGQLVEVREQVLGQRQVGQLDCGRLLLP